jgi:hypothetical protein
MQQQEKKEASVSSRPDERIYDRKSKLNDVFMQRRK